MCNLFLYKHNRDLVYVKKKKRINNKITISILCSLWHLKNSTKIFEELTNEVPVLH